MSFVIYSVYDAKKKEFSIPFYAVNEQEALRMFYVMLSTTEVMRTCQKDFDLYKVGEMSTEHGEILGVNDLEDTGLFVEGDDFVARYEKGEFVDGE